MSLEPEQIATVRIELVDTDPLIWREVEVPTAITLKGLHDVVQAAMGWGDYHMWEFAVGGQRYGEPPPDDDGWDGPPTIRADRTRLDSLLRPRRTVLDYLYDFGDCWEHRLTITRVRPGEAGVTYPRYVAGERAAPPEDCGGLPGFYEALAGLADPKRPDHEELREWWGDYDPDACDERLVAMAMGRVAKHLASAKTRRWGK